MARPWLSVVMPTKAGERWIAQALLSVCREGEPGIECIVIDSSDTEETVRVAEAFRGRMALRIERRVDFTSWQASTNYGVQIASAPYISILHQDDLWLPGRAAAVRRWLAADPDAILHVNPSRIIDRSGRALGTWRCPLSAAEAVPAETFLERLLVQNFIAIPAPVVRRDQYLAAGGLDEKLWYTADWDLYLKLGRMGRTRYHAEALTAFRIHGASLTISGSRSAADFREQLRIVVDRHADALPQGCRQRVLKAARASIDVNTALADAYNGQIRAVARGGMAMLRLGPLGLVRYLRDSRLIERLLPRVRAMVAGGL